LLIQKFITILVSKFICFFYLKAIKFFNILFYFEDLQVKKKISSSTLNILSISATDGESFSKENLMIKNAPGIY